MPDDQTETPDAGDARYESYLLRLWQETPAGERALGQTVDLSRMKGASV